MRSKLAVFIVLLLAAITASAQTTAVTATVTDSDGTAWINAPYTITFVGSKPGKPSVNGQTFTQVFSGTTNGSGQMSQTMADVAAIVPANSTWQFTITPAVSGGHTFLVNIPITGASEDVSSLINAVITAPRLSGGVTIQGYADVEVAALSGNTYYRIGDGTQRCYTSSWTSCATAGSGADKSSTSPQVFNAAVASPTLQSSVRPFIDVTAPPYNAACNGGDDTTAIQAAITAAQRSTANCGTNSTAPTANCTGVVFFPNVFCAATHVQMGAYVKLQGTGPTNSGLVQLASSNQNFITGTNPTVDQRMVISDLSINGNKANQTGTFDCIHWDGTGALGTVRSPRNEVDNSWVQNCGQDAISIFGDAGSDYVNNSKGFQSGRFGLNLDAYDSHVSGGEFYSNGTAGVNLGTHGNGSATDNKVWGNGTGTAGDGMRVGSGNWRIDSVDAQDNACNGMTATGNSLVMTALLLDGNGNTGGGNGCAGISLSAVNYSYISASFNAHVDAGTSDYAVAFVGSNNKNIIDMPISDASPPLVSTYSGTINNNNFRGNTVNGELHNINQEFLNGVNLRGFSDTGATQQWALLSNIGQLSIKSLILNSGATMSSPPRMNFSGSSGTTFTGINTNYGGSYTPTAAITITGFDIHMDTAGVGCSTWPIVAVYDETAAAAVAGTSITLSATVNMHTTASANVPAGHVLAFATTTAGVGCSTSPTSPHFNAEYVMQ